MGKRRGVSRAVLALGLASAAASLAYRRTKAGRPVGVLPRPPRGFVLTWRQEALRLREHNHLLYERAWRLVEENSRLRADIEASRATGGRDRS